MTSTSKFINHNSECRYFKSDPPLVSVLIVTWNRKEDVLEAVRSIYEQAYPNFEIIVVDNGSTDGTPEALSKAYPDIKLTTLDSNVGIAGRNIGIKGARGDIIFCLDSDASLATYTLNNLVRKFRDDPMLGVIETKIVNAYTQKLDNVLDWTYSAKDLAEQDNEFFSWTFSEGGCAIRREVFDRIGLFWEFLFFGCEGQEFSLRALDAGYKILYYPHALVYHRVSPQKRIEGGERDYLLFRNSLYIYLVRFPWWLLLLFLPLKTVAVLIRSVRRRYLRRIISAFLDVIQKLPVLWKQRKPISNKTARCYMQLQRQHGSLRWDLVSWVKYKT